MDRKGAKFGNCKRQQTFPFTSRLVWNASFSPNHNSSPQNLRNFAYNCKNCLCIRSCVGPRVYLCGAFGMLGGVRCYFNIFGAD